MKRRNFLKCLAAVSAFCCGWFRRRPVDTLTVTEGEWRKPQLPQSMVCCGFIPEGESPLKWDDYDMSKFDIQYDWTYEDFEHVTPIRLPVYMNRETGIIFVHGYTFLRPNPLVAPCDESSARTMNTLDYHSKCDPVFDTFV